MSANFDIVNDAQPVDQHGDSEEAISLSDNVIATLPSHISNLSLARSQNEVTNYSSANRPSPQIINIVGGSDVHIGPNILIPAHLAQNAAGSGERNNIQVQPKILKTRTIDNMLKSTDTVDQECIQLVAENLGIGWQSVLRRLGQTDAFIEQIDRDFQRDGTKEIIYRGLRAWMRNAEDDEATIGVLTSVLWRNGHRSCVVKLKEWFKSRTPNEK